MSANTGDKRAGATGTEGAADRLRLSLLGPVSGHRGEVPLELGPVRRQAVLAALVLRAETLVTHQQLLDDVWGLEPPGTGRRVLPSYVYPLRKALDAPGTGPAASVIRGERGGYRFVCLPGQACTDVREVAADAASIRGARTAGDLAAALGGCTRALSRFRGEPLAGLPGPLADAERQRLTRQRRTLHQERAECLVLLGRYAEALDALDALPAIPSAHPHDEPLAALRMRALYGSGRQAEALAVYRETRDRLRGELGVEPGDELRRVHQGVLRRDDTTLLGRPPSPDGSGTATAEAPPSPAGPAPLFRLPPPRCRRRLPPRRRSRLPPRPRLRLPPRCRRRLPPRRRSRLPPRPRLRLPSRCRRRLLPRRRRRLPPRPRLRPPSRCRPRLPSRYRLRLPSRRRSRLPPTRRSRPLPRCRLRWPPRRHPGEPSRRRPWLPPRYRPR
ncbi:AfsR/SARP family transcriptional regulator [Streptomyces sp. G5(2025)]|uniref:AfsR/SARP family transcriptional regulator n=1 Tax=Streptomyces sp. G5(2025) TaxID=3406628 RepID=UPI003C1B30DF